MPKPVKINGRTLQEGLVADAVRKAQEQGNNIEAVNIDIINAAYDQAAQDIADHLAEAGPDYGGQPGRLLNIFSQMIRKAYVHHRRLYDDREERNDNQSEESS